MSQPGHQRWAGRHPILTGTWLVLAAIWLTALIAVYDDDPVVSVFAWFIIMVPVTLVIAGLGILGDRITQRREQSASLWTEIPDGLPSSGDRPAAETTVLRQKLDAEAARQREIALRLGQREAELGHREADLRLREALLQPGSSRQPVLLPEAKSTFDPVIIQPDRLPAQSAPAKFCFNCGAWFARDDETCRLCGAPRVGARA